jgi:hypothetical protein
MFKTFENFLIESADLYDYNLYTLEWLLRIESSKLSFKSNSTLYLKEGSDFLSNHLGDIDEIVLLTFWKDPFNFQYEHDCVLGGPYLPELKNTDISSYRWDKLKDHLSWKDSRAGYKNGVLLTEISNLPLAIWNGKIWKFPLVFVNARTLASSEHIRKVNAKYIFNLAPFMTEEVKRKYRGKISGSKFDI